MINLADDIAVFGVPNEELGYEAHQYQEFTAIAMHVAEPPGPVAVRMYVVDASGEASLGVLAAQVTTRLSDAIATERKRSAIATTVFSFSLLVFSALIAFLLLGRVSDVAARLRAKFVDDPATQQLLLFTGYSGVSILDDTWTYG